MLSMSHLPSVAHVVRSKVRGSSFGHGNSQTEMRRCYSKEKLKSEESVAISRLSWQYLYLCHMALRRLSLS